MPNDLDTIASDLMAEDDTQTTDNTVETTEVEEKTAPEDTAKDQSQSKAPQDTQQSRKQSRKDVENKRYEDLRSFTDRKNNEYVAKIKALEDRLSTYSPIDPLLPDLKKILEQRKQQEFQEKFQQDPVAANKQLLQEMLSQTIAPFQQQAQQAEMKQTVNDSISYLKTTYGDQAFTEVSPIMKDILDNTSQQFGPEVSDLLARNPDHLFMTAFGQLAYQKIRDFNSQKEAGNQNKQNLAKVAAGVSKPNRTTRTNSDNTSREAIEQAAFAFLEGKN